jgi:hypothetical protein
MMNQFSLVRGTGLVNGLVPPVSLRIPALLLYKDVVNGS